MKRIAKWVLVLVAVCGWMVLPMMAEPVMLPLPLQAQAHYHATHEMIVEYSDLTGTATNTAQSFTNGIAAPAIVSLVGMKLERAFDTENTNYTGSLAIKVGDGSDDDLFLTSTELASDGAEVFVKYAPANTLTTTVLTNVVYNGTTGNVTVATGAVGTLGTKTYSTDGSVVVTVTPNAEEAVAANKKGRVRLLFDIFGY